MYRKSENARAWGYVAPSIIIIFGVVMYPLIYSFVISLFKWDLATPNDRPFIALQNYVSLFQRPQFVDSLWLTIVFTVLSLAFTMIFGILIALYLNRDFAGRNFMRMVILIPWILPSVVVGITWEWIFNANYGVLNAILSGLGIIDSYRNWLGDSSTAFGALLFVKCWKEIPFVALMYLAGFQTISKDLVEAAQIEGMNRFQIFSKITMPLIRPVTLVVIVMQTMWTFRVFDIVYVMTGGGPANKTMVVAYYAYLENFKFYHLGTGAAMSWIITLVILVASIVYLRVIQQND